MYHRIFKIESEFDDQYENRYRYTQLTATVVDQPASYKGVIEIQYEDSDDGWDKLYACPSNTANRNNGNTSGTINEASAPNNATHPSAVEDPPAYNFMNVEHLIADRKYDGYKVSSGCQHGTKGSQYLICIQGYECMPP